MKKKLLVAGFIIAALPLVFIAGTKGKTSSYYNGDALYYQGVVYLTTTNSGMAELFTIENNTIKKVSQIKAISKKMNSGGYIDAVLNVEQRGLFLFLTDGKYVYKYDINDPTNPILYKRSNDQTNSNFTGLGKIDNKVYSVSNQGTKIWNDDMVVFYNSTLSNPIPHNLKFSKKGSFIFNINNDKLEIYDAYSQKLLSLTYINASDNHERNIFNDENDSTIYLVDDYSVKQFDFAGNLIKSFKHNSEQGYDIAYTPGDDHLFFSDGIGIVKLSKHNLKPLRWSYNKNLDERGGGWATGLKVVRDNYGEKIIIFNKTNITILNQDFKKVGSIEMPYDAASFFIEESLSITLDKHSGSPGSEVMINGKGFDPGEDLSIYLLDKKIASAKADNNGRFTTTITIPAIKSAATDIRVAGDISGKSYSSNFRVDSDIINLAKASLSVTLDKNEAFPGDEVMVSGTGFDPGEYVLIYLDFDKISVTKADSNGSFSQLVKIPLTAKVGPTNIRAVGYDSVKSFSVDFRVKEIRDKR